MALKLSKNQKENLINEVIEQIKYDILIGDVTAIDELLRFVPEINLIGYLPDIDDIRYNDLKEVFVVHN
jgi:hypothetical protein